MTVTVTVTDCGYEGYSVQVAAPGQWPAEHHFDSDDHDVGKKLSPEI